MKRGGQKITLAEALEIVRLDVKAKEDTDEYCAVTFRSDSISDLTEKDASTLIAAGANKKLYWEVKKPSPGWVLNGMDLGYIHDMPNNFLSKFDDKEGEALALAILAKFPNKLYSLYREPSEDLILKMVNREPDSIQYVRDPSLSIQLIAVRADIELVPYIDNIHKETVRYVIEHATEMHRNVFNCIEKDPELQLLCLDRFPHLFRHIADPTEAVKLKAIAMDPANILHVKNPTEEQQLLALTGKLVQRPDREFKSTLAFISYIADLNELPMPDFSLSSQIESYRRYPDSLPYLTRSTDVLSAMKTEGEDWNSSSAFGE